jgi:hypothetical protein
MINVACQTIDGHRFIDKSESGLGVLRMDAITEIVEADGLEFNVPEKLFLETPINHDGVTDLDDGATRWRGVDGHVWALQAISHRRTFTMIVPSPEQRHEWIRFMTPLISLPSVVVSPVSGDEYENDFDDLRPPSRLPSPPPCVFSCDDTDNEFD